MMSAPENPTVADEAAESEEPKLNLAIKVDSPSACERHVTVTIPREDIDRYYDKVYSEMQGTAAVPGFRIGRAPRKLIESRFKGRGRSGQRLAADGQHDADHRGKGFSAISERLRSLAVEIPDEGPMKFEFDIGSAPVRSAQWKG